MANLPKSLISLLQFDNYFGADVFLKIDLKEFLIRTSNTKHLILGFSRYFLL